MSVHTVRLQSAAGTTRDENVPAYNESGAIREALRRANQDAPGSGWLAVWVLS